MLSPLRYFFFFQATTAASLIAVGLVTTAPELGAPGITQNHSLTANGLTAGAATLGTPAALGEGSAAGLLIGAPTLATVTLTQMHGLSATGLIAVAPELSVATIPEPDSANGLISGDPLLSLPTLTQNHSVISTGLAASAPTIGSPVLSSSISAGDGLISGAPILGSPVFAQQQSLTATGLTIGAPAIGSPAQNAGISFVCAPDIVIEKELQGSVISPSADLRLKITLTRNPGDIDPGTSRATDYTNCIPEFAVYRHGGTTAIATLTLANNGISRATNTASCQVFVVLWPQASVVTYKGRMDMLYRFTVTTADGAIVSGNNSDPAYSGRFSIARY